MFVSYQVDETDLGKPLEDLVRRYLELNEIKVPEDAGLVIKGDFIEVCWESDEQPKED